MRIVSWNMGAAYGPYVERHDAAWRHLEGLEPDVALLEECIPAAWALRRWTVIKAPFSFWTTGIAVPTWKATEVEIPPDNLLARFPGYVAAADVEVPGSGSVLVVSVHASAHAAKGRTLRGIDPDALRRPSAEEPWWNDLFFAGAVELVAGRRFIVGGDWNTARYLDKDGMPEPVGAEFFARAEAAGWVDLHHVAVGHEERTWYGRRNPRPYMPDHVFADPETAALIAGARVEAEPAEDGLSDHAPVILEGGVAVAVDGGSDERVAGSERARAAPDRSPTAP